VGRLGREAQRRQIHFEDAAPLQVEAVQLNELSEAGHVLVAMAAVRAECQDVGNGEVQQALEGQPAMAEKHCTHRPRHQVALESCIAARLQVGQHPVAAGEDVTLSCGCGRLISLGLKTHVVKRHQLRSEYTLNFCLFGAEFHDNG